MPKSAQSNQLVARCNFEGRLGIPGWNESMTIIVEGGVSSLDQKIGLSSHYQ